MLKRVTSRSHQPLVNQLFETHQTVIILPSCQKKGGTGSCLVSFGALAFTSFLPRTRRKIRCQVEATICLVGQAGAKNTDRPDSYPHGMFEELKSSEVLQHGGKSGKVARSRRAGVRPRWALPAVLGSGSHPLCDGKLPKAFEQSD